MRLRFRWVIFVSLLVLAPAAPSLGDLLPLPDCRGLGCLRIATPAQWPVPLQDSFYSLELQQYVVALPAPPKRILRQLSGELVVAGQDGSWLTFNLVSSYSDTTAPVARDKVPALSNFSIAESGEMTFTKTIQDPAPTNPNDLWVWRQALYFKMQVFGKDNPVHRINQGTLTVYYGVLPEMEDAMQAYAFDASNSDTYIRIFAQGMDLQGFTKILGAMTLSQ